MAIPVAAAIPTAAVLVRGDLAVLPIALVFAAVAGALLGVCALAGAQAAIIIARETHPRSWVWRQLFALCVAAATFLLALPTTAWLTGATAAASLLPYLVGVAAIAYLCGAVVCPPLSQVLDVNR
ncbi:hypothetical protein FCG67_01305 [Rhodococcus oryzae]|uniref:Uncharacterized protein n=1 Tax=Rhodococcus oryzae TaxID=2571143 RepID=A0ABY2RQI9_9NOCA|nr:hypothetical protein [Rhodococcus oryzae]TJZ81312.1 hypothetical protein FCG67_01305 [Rhodococcus oryzae]